MRSGTARFYAAVAEASSGPAARDVVRIRASTCMRDTALILAAGTFALMWFGEQAPVPTVSVSRLGRGRSGTQTSSLAISPDGSSIATADTNGRLARRDARRGWAVD